MAASSTDVFLTKLKGRNSQLRGELKTKSTPLIEQGYNLIRLSADKPKRVQRLAARVTKLLDDVSFVYRVRCLYLLSFWILKLALGSGHTRWPVP